MLYVAWPAGLRSRVLVCAHAHGACLCVRARVRICGWTSFQNGNTEEESLRVNIVTFLLWINGLNYDLAVHILIFAVSPTQVAALDHLLRTWLGLLISH